LHIVEVDGYYCQLLKSKRHLPAKSGQYTNFHENCQETENAKEAFLVYCSPEEGKATKKPTELGSKAYKAKMNYTKPNS